METPSQALLLSISPPASPYRGVLSFRLLDQCIFFGRKIQQEQIFRLICIYRGTLLYGDSGSGKSSLINAGLIPLLIKEGFEVERLRLQPRLDEEIVLERIPLNEDQHAPALPSIFSTGTHSEASERPTLSLSEFNNHLSRHRQSDAPVRVLIFDQFEELVTQFEDNKTTKAAYDKAKTIQKTIIENLHELLTKDRPGIKILFAFREDYFGRLAQLFPSIPQLKDQSLRLTSPSLDSLPAMISGPFQVPKLTFSRKLKPGTDSHLENGFTAHSTNGLINLTEVQIACASVWEDPAENIRFLQEKIPRTAVQSIFDNYVPRTVTAKLDRGLHSIAYNALNRLVTPGGPAGIGTRNIVSQANLLDSLKKDGHREVDIDSTLKALCDDARLVFQQTRGTTPFYEIVSEFLVKGITAKLPGVLKARSDHEARLLQIAVDEKTKELSNRTAELETKTTELGDKNRSLKRGAYVLGGIFIVALFLAIWAFQERSKAVIKTKEAEVANEDLKISNAKLTKQITLTQNARLAEQQALREEKARDAQNATLLTVSQEKNAQLIDELNKLRGQTTDVTAAKGIGEVIKNLDNPLIARLAGAALPVRVASYSPDGRYIALGSEDKKLRLYSRLGGKAVAEGTASSTKEGTASSSKGGVSALAFSPDGSFLLTGSAGSSLRLFDPRLPKLGQGKELPVKLNTVIFIGFSPDGKFSVATDSDGEVAVLDWSNYPKQLPQKPAVFKNSSLVSYASFRTDGQRLVISSDEPRPGGKPNYVRVLLANTSPLKELSVKYGGSDILPGRIDAPTRRLRFSPIDPNLIIGSAGKALLSISLLGNRAPYIQDSSQAGEYFHASGIVDTAFSPDGKRVASIGTEGLCIIWDAATAKSLTLVPTKLHGRLLALGWQGIQGKSLLALGGEDGGLELWDMSGSVNPTQLAYQVQAHSAPLIGLQFDPLNEQLLTWSGSVSDNTPSRPESSPAGQSWKAWQTDPKRSEAETIPPNQPALWSLPNALRQATDR